MILLTGASGFIGKRLRYGLAEKFGIENIILLTTGNIDGFRCILHKDFILESNVWDVNDIHDIQTVIHLGAFTPKTHAQGESWDHCTSNILSTHSLLSILPENVQKFIFISTLDIYERTASAITELTAIDPVSLYGRSKLYCEDMLQCWAKDKGTVLQILRLGHIYGPGEEAYAKIIPLTIKNVLNNIEPVIYSSGEERRSFLYIDDCCNYIIASMGLEAFEGPINVVSNHDISIKNLIEKIILISESDLQPKILNQDIQGRDYKFDNKKLEDLFGPASVSLDQGLAKEIEEFKSL